MRQVYSFAVIVALMIVPGRSVGQQNLHSANLHSAHRAVADSLATQSGGKITCTDISASINGILRAHSVTQGSDGSALPKEISLGNLGSRDLDCGAIPAIAAGAHFELMKIFFDRTLHSWEFQLRCGHISDCVPFLVRWPRTAGDDPIKWDRVVPAHGGSSAARTSPPKGTHFLLRRGETVTLVWDQDGIRVVLPAICLEQGNVGESIRVRTKNGGRVLRAEIVNALLLRVVL